MTQATLTEFYDKWKGWRIGFSHFMQLTEEPTESCLWYLLSRRAAGMFPRDQAGADLFFPIVLPGAVLRVSVVLIQVKTLANGDAEAARQLRPSYAFNAGNELRNKSPDDVIRAILSLKGPTKPPKRMYRKDLEQPADPSLNNMPVLVIKAIETGGFVSTGLRSALHELLFPPWDMMELVTHDLKLRKADLHRSPHVVSAEKIEEIARKPIGDLLDMMDGYKKAVMRKRRSREGKGGKKPKNS